jgi:hypothetical protein
MCNGEQSMFGFPKMEVKVTKVLFRYYVYFIGTVLQSNARRIPDYAIVPIDGFPVDRTVKDIATNAWLVRRTVFYFDNNLTEISVLSC